MKSIAATLCLLYTIAVAASPTLSFDKLRFENSILKDFLYIDISEASPPNRLIYKSNLPDGYASYNSTVSKSPGKSWSDWVFTLALDDPKLDATPSNPSSGKGKRLDAVCLSATLPITVDLDLYLAAALNLKVYGQTFGQDLQDSRVFSARNGGFKHHFSACFEQGSAAEALCDRDAKIKRPVSIEFYARLELEVGPSDDANRGDAVLAGDVEVAGVGGSWEFTPVWGDCSYVGTK